jgi:hypothetical protein
MRSRRAAQGGAPPLNCGVRRMVRGIAFFSLGILGAVAVYAAASIYGFDYFEPHWGRGISLQVSLWIAVVLAAIGAVDFAVGARMVRATPSRSLALVAGLLVAVVMLGLTALLDPVVATTGGRQLLTAGVVFVLSLVAALLFRSKRGASA